MFFAVINLLYQYPKYHTLVSTITVLEKFGVRKICLFVIFSLSKSVFGTFLIRINFTLFYLTLLSNRSKVQLSMKTWECVAGNTLLNREKP